MNDDGLDNAVSEDAGSSTLSLTLPPIGDCVYVNLCDSQSAMVQPGRPAKSNLKFGVRIRPIGLVPRVLRMQIGALLLPPR